MGSVNNDKIKNGFLDIEVDDKIDILSEINQMRKEKNAVVLAHYYQESEVQDIADFVGDSLDLSRKAAETTADIIPAVQSTPVKP